MKLYKICNKISLLLHALCSAAGYFLIEAISRHSFTDAWTYMTGKPLVFVYNTAFIFTTMLIVYLFHRRVFWRVVVSVFWLFLGIVNCILLLNRVTPFTGPDLHMLTHEQNFIRNLRVVQNLRDGAGGQGDIVLLVVGRHDDGQQSHNKPSFPHCFAPYNGCIP